MVIEPCDGNQRGPGSKPGQAENLIFQPPESRPVVEFGRPPDQGFDQNRAVVGIGHHHHALSLGRQQDQLGLIADILASFHKDERALGFADGGAEAIRTAIWPGQHLARRLGLEKQAALAPPGAANSKKKTGKIAGRRPVLRPFHSISYQRTQ